MMENDYGVELVMVVVVVDRMSAAAGYQGEAENWTGPNAVPGIRSAVVCASTYRH